MRISKMAWRNLWRNRRRTLVTTTAMALALLVAILYSGLVEGLLVNMEKDTLGFEIGAVQVFAKGYQDRPSLYTGIKDADAVVKKLTDEGIPATPRLLGAGLAASGESSAGVQLRGIDVDLDAKVLALPQQVSKGEWLDPAHPQGVVLGRRLADTLGVQPGSELIVLSQAADGSIANDLFRVRGVLRSVGEMTDRAGVMMHAATFRSLMAYEGGAHQIIVKRPLEMTLDAMVAAVRAVAPDDDVQSWKEVIPVLATMVESTRSLIKLIFVIFNIVVAIVVLNAMLMAVFERIKEFGVFKALGAGPWAVLELIFMESMIQVALAIIAGVVVSLPVVWYLAKYGINMQSLSGVSMMGMAMVAEWRAVVTPQIYAGPIVMLVIIVGIAVLYPSIKAARLHPVEAMRHR